MDRVRILRAFLPLALLLGLPPAAAVFAQTASVPAESMMGQPVVAVRVVEESGQVRAENPADLDLHPGVVLGRDALRSSLRRLYASGRYAEISAQVFTLPGGVRVDFLVRDNFFIGNVRIQGLNEPPSESQALGTLRLGLGETFRQRELDAGLERVRQLLRDDGFYGAIFHPDLARRPETQLVDVTLRVVTGPRARIASVAAST